MPRLKWYGPGAAEARLARWQPSLIAIDTETSGVGFYDEAFCATITWRRFAMSPGRATWGLESAYVSLEGPDADENRLLLRAILRRTPTWVFHHAKFDLQKLLLAGVLEQDDVDLHDFEDTQILHALIDENDRHGLKYLARALLGEETDEEAVLRKVRRKLGLRKDDGYQDIPRKYLRPYAVKDTEMTLRLFELLRPRLDATLLDLYATELQLVKVLLRMEANGLALDLPYLDETTSEFGTKVMQGWNRVTELTDRPDLNPQSPIQLKEAFAERGLELESTAVDVLRSLDDELAEAILAYRSDKKIHTTYLKALLAEQRGGLVHPHFNSVGPRTGRMSSSAASN